MLVNRLTATLVNRLIAKLMNRLTAKLVVVNLVKLHLTKSKNVQLVLQHCCKMSWIAMLRILPPMFKPVNNLICCQTGLMRVVKCTTLLFNSFWSKLQDKLHIFCSPFFRTLTLFRNILNNVSGNNFYLLQRMNANYRSTALAIVDDDIIIIKLLLTLKPATHQNL